MDIGSDRGHACRFTKRGRRPRVFESMLIGKTENAISGATDAQIRPSRRQNDRVDEHYIIMEKYYPFDGFRGTEMAKKAAGLLLGLGDDRCSKFHNSSSRTRNLEVENFLERCFSYLQVVFRSRGGLKAVRALKRTKCKTVQIWVMFGLDDVELFRVRFSRRNRTKLTSRVC